MTQSRFAVLAPSPEGELVERILRDHGHDCGRIRAHELAEQVRRGGIGALIVAEESLGAIDVLPLREALDVQPPWSDLPVLVLIDRGRAEAHAALFDQLGQVRLVERPVEPFIIERAALAALRSRSRQSGARTMLQEIEEAEASYRRLSEALETRIGQRTRQLEAAYDRLVREAEERWTAEERLRESEELYRYTVELSQQLAWTADAEGTILSISPRFGALTGLGDSVPPHEGWLRAMHPDDAEGVLDHWRERVAAGAPSSIDFRMRLADGSYRMFRTRAAPRRDESGKIIRWYGTTEDIEDQTRAEEERQVAEERYRLAAYATNDAIWDLDLLADEIHWAPSAGGFFGYGDVVDTTALSWWEDRIHPEDRERASSSLAAAIEGGESHWEEDYRFRCADGGYADVHDQGFILRDADGRAVRAVGAMADVTDKRRAEAELRKMQSDLIHVSRLSAMGAMASTLAHEINQPLTAITNYLRGSRRMLDTVEGETMPQIREALGAAEGGALRAGQIVRRLRELVARGNVSMKTEDLPALIEEACVLGFVDARLMGVSHRVQTDPAARWVFADRIQIQQVLINLIRNAVQAMKEGPRRDVRISTALSSDSMVEVSVADTGSGLADEIREAVFSPFRSTKAEGLGIGLSISRTIVEAHGGRIWAEDRRGGGTVFRFTIPIADTDGTPAEADPL